MIVSSKTEKKILAEKLKKLGYIHRDDDEKAILEVFNAISWNREGHGDRIKVNATCFYKRDFEGKRKQSVKVEFEVTPEQLGFKKKFTVKVASFEDNVVNLETRKVESGYYLFDVDVEFPDEAGWENVYGFVASNGKGIMVYTDSKQLYTAGISVNQLKESWLTNWKESYHKRKLLKEKLPKDIYYVISKHGERMVRLEQRS